jgi:hypothetical protein
MADERKREGVLSWASFWIAVAGVFIGVPVLLIQLDDGYRHERSDAIMALEDRLNDREASDPLVRCLYTFGGVNKVDDCNARLFASQESVTQALSYVEQLTSFLGTAADFQSEFCNPSVRYPWRRPLQWCEDISTEYADWIKDVKDDPSGLIRFSVSGSQTDRETFVGPPCHGRDCDDKIILFNEDELNAGVAAVKARLERGLPPNGK